MARLAASAALGALLGFLASRMLFLQAATLIPWGVAALAVGVISRDLRQALTAGAVYGFALGLSFMTFGYNGTDPLLGKVPFFAIIGVISAVFGVALSLAGRWFAAWLGGARGGVAR